MTEIKIFALHNMMKINDHFTFINSFSLICAAWENISLGLNWNVGWLVNSLKIMIDNILHHGQSCLGTCRKNDYFVKVVFWLTMELFTAQNYMLTCYSLWYIYIGFLLHCFESINLYKLKDKMVLGKLHHIFWTYSAKCKLINALFGHITPLIALQCQSQENMTTPA